MIRPLVISAIFCITALACVYVYSWCQLKPYFQATVINTWPWKEPNDAAWSLIENNTCSALEAVVAACSVAEANEAIVSVGAGGSPDEEGNTTLSALVMDGNTMDVGAVAEMSYIKEAIKVALGVLKSTRHTLLAGEAATRFAESLGYHRTSLVSNTSTQDWKQWKANNCQPNFRVSYYWAPDPEKSCGPYRHKNGHTESNILRPELGIDEVNHDTIGAIALDRCGRLAVGLSTNGARFRIPGRVGDSPIPGAGGYADSRIGAAAGTGDGDVMMRFLLSFKAVELMKAGKHPQEACSLSLQTVRQKGAWYGALVALRVDGQYGAACVGFENFAFVVRNDNSARGGKVVTVKCINPRDLDT